MQISIAILLINSRLAYSCARTAEGGGGVTTPTEASPTTAAEEATTTTANPCTQCDNNEVQLLADPADPVNSHPPTAANGAPENGCKTLVVTCTPINNNPQSLLTFQNGLGGPPPGNPSQATLVCNDQRQWIYTSAGVSTAITQAYCLG